MTLATIAWYGFTDIESGIASYFVSVGSSYNGGEFTKGFIEVLGNKTTAAVSLYNFSPNIHGEIVLSIYAVNNAGIKSKIAKATVVTSSSDKWHSSGSFLLQRHSCKTHFCENDCTCGIVGKKCVSKDQSRCLLVNDTLTDVYLGTSNHTTIAVQASTSCMVGSWLPRSNLIIRYQWTLGLTDGSPGQGVFDVQKENPWTDNDLETSILFCLPVGKTFEPGQNYVLYVKSWISDHQYSISKSKHISIKNSSPRIDEGQFIKTSRNKACGTNIRYSHIDWKICCCWQNVFTDKGPLMYTFSVGTSQKCNF